jgi:hypothetical protein
MGDAAATSSPEQAVDPATALPSAVPARTLPGRPIFIGGDGRSGTTLLNVVLDSHPHLAVSPELHFNGAHNLGPHVLGSIDLILAKDRRVKSKELVNHPDLKPGVQFVRRVERAGLSIDDMRSLIPKAMRITGSDLDEFPDRCALIHEFGELLRKRAGKERYGFKIMREIRNVTKYARVWPGAQFIHIVRDGRDVAASQMLEHASWGYNDIDNAARGWVSLIRESRRHAQPYSMLEIRYEDLVLQPEPTLRRILEFLGEPWHEDVLRHDEVDHVFFDTRIQHPSRKAAKKPINASAVGRYRRDLSPEQVERFERIAADSLIEIGYMNECERRPALSPDSSAPIGVGEAVQPTAPSAPATDAAAEAEAAICVHRVRLGYSADGCFGLRNCARFVRNAHERLVGKYLGLQTPCEGQIVDAVIDLRGLTWEAYVAWLKQRYKGNVVRDARKADRAGFVCKPFVRANHVPDVVEINHSKAERCGRPMRQDYLKSVASMGGAPKHRVGLKPPDCPLHYDMWWGVFAPQPGYTQGDITTNERLIAYINLRRIGAMALYSLILGHGDFLEHGIMYRLHFEIMQWILGRDEPASRGLDFLMYAGFNQGGDGLRLWKKKTAFEPAHLVVIDGPPPPGPPAAVRRAAAVVNVPSRLWGKLRNLLR